MAFELKDGQGTLHKNDKEDNPARPDYRGDLMLNGAMYAVSGWLKESKSGTKWMSLKVEPKRERQSASKHDADGDIPF